MDCRIAAKPHTYIRTYNSTIKEYTNFIYLLPTRNKSNEVHDMSRSGNFSHSIEFKTRIDILLPTQSMQRHFKKVKESNRNKMKKNT